MLACRTHTAERASRADRPVHVTPFRMLGYGEVLDAGYGEFMCTLEYAAELMNGGMTHVNGQPVRLQIVDRGLDSVNAVIVRVIPLPVAVADVVEWRLAA